MEYIAGRLGDWRSALTGKTSDGLERRLLQFALLLGVVNLLVLIVQAPELVHHLYLNSDHASALVLPALAGRTAAGAVVSLGDHPWYESWWFMRATSGLPHYRQIWEAAPFVIALFGIASVAACAGWALGGGAAVQSGLVLLASGAALRGVLYVPESRVGLVVHMGVLCGALLFVHHRWSTGRLTSRALVVLGVPLVLFTGAGSTDQLLVVAGLGPLLLAPLACRFARGCPGWRVLSTFAVTVSLFSVLLAAGLDHLMQDRGIVHASFPISFVASNETIVNLQNLIAAFASLGGGSFFGMPVSGSHLLVFLLGASSLVALAMVLRWIWRWAWDEPLRQGAAGEDQRRDLFIAYWGLVVLLVLAAYALTSVSNNQADGRYLLGAWIAVAALLGASRHSRARVAVIGGTCLFALLSLRANLFEGVPAYGLGPDPPLAGEIEHFALAHGASVGYAGYWQASPITWETDLRLKVYPVQPCSSSSGLCSFSNVYISSWYKTKDLRSFLVTSSLGGIPLEVASASPSFGHPLTQAVVGPYTVYIYGHDIADSLGA